MDTRLQYTGFDFKRAEINEFTTVINKREVPCDNCKFEDRCAARFEDCKAFRFWAKNGDFKDADVGKLIRVSKG